MDLSHSQGLKRRDDRTRACETCQASGTLGESITRSSCS